VKIAHFFIDRPVFAIVISFVTIIAGTIAVFTLPIAQYPEIVPPTVTVSTTYPGASAETIAKTVATPIEEQVNGVEHMLYMSSQSDNTGSLTLTVTFKVGTNLDVAQVQVQNRVAVALPQLPPEVQQEGVTVKKASPNITVAVALYSPDGSHDPLFISNYATLQLKDQIARLPGVGDTSIFGVRDYPMRLWLDPDKLAARDITVGDVISAVKEQNVQVAAGLIGGPPLPPHTDAAFEYTLNAQGRLTEPSQFGEIIVKVGRDGRVTRLNDVGRVGLGAADYSTANSYNGRPCVGLVVYQLPGTKCDRYSQRHLCKNEGGQETIPSWPRLRDCA
jgi:multidrug efflux pump